MSYGIISSWAIRQEAQLDNKIQSWPSLIFATFATFTPIIFIWFEVNKLHLIWMFVIMIFLSYILGANNIPLISPLFKGLSYLYIKILIVGTNTPCYYHTPAKNNFEEGIERKF
jgi:predicted membrane channel-forming protein YqfA (hemolysin III family)